MRLFIASSFKPAFTANLAAIADHARGLAGRDSVKWVAPSNFHLTYAFLGDMDQGGAAVAEKGIETCLEGAGAFEIVSSDLGVFPPSGLPGVLWLGVGEGASRLGEISGKLAEVLAARGVLYDNRFAPHITIGRVKKPLPENFLGQAGAFTAGRKVPSLITSVELMESVLSPEGTVYRTVYSKKLL